MYTVKDWLTNLPESICPYAVRAMLKTLSLGDDFTHLAVLHEVLERIYSLVSYMIVNPKGTHG